MVSKKSSVIIAAIVALFCFWSAVYVTSCTKPGKVVNCDNVGCQNGGFCVVDTVNKVPIPTCVCPSGYEGATCETASVTKFLGYWNVVQTVIGSDSANIKGTDTMYTAQLIATPTPTTFMIYNFCGDQNYNDIICTIDSTNTNDFVIDTLSAFHMVFDHFKLTKSANGIITPGSSITTTLCIYHINYNRNWQHDTLSIVMKPQ